MALLRAGAALPKDLEPRQRLSIAQKQNARAVASSGGLLEY
jgi:hypothetical protein